SLQGFLPSDFLRLDVANGISGNIGLTATGVGAGQTREFRFYELAANGAEYSAFKAPDAMSTSLTYVLPSSAPAAGDILKATVPSSGVVTLSWGADAGAGGGISNFNGSNQSSQSFTAVDIAAAITAPAWSTNTGTGAHTLQIPMAAGTGVTGGLITKAEHTTFSSKVDRAGDTMTGLLNFTGASGISLANTSGITFTGTGTIAMGANKITGVADPSAAQEAATKAYVDSQNSGKISGTLTATRIPFASGASTLTDSANFTYTAATGAMTIGGTAPSITSNDAINIAAGGTNKNVVLTPSGTGYTLLNGNVGVGTATPVAELHVKGLSNTSSVLIEPSSAGTAGLYLGNTSAARRGIFEANNLTGEIKIGGNFSSYYPTFYSGGLEAMRISTSGNVGIGSTNPLASLDIISKTGSGYEALRIENSNILNYTGGIVARAATNSAFFQAANFGNTYPTLVIQGVGGQTGNLVEYQANGGGVLSVIDTNGRMGIGTTSPASKLHVGSAPTASANYGLLSLGSGPFDGSTAGYFGTGSTSNANGTVIAANVASGYTGDLMNLQMNGATKFKVDGAGSITTTGTISSLPVTIASNYPTSSAMLTINRIPTGGDAQYPLVVLGTNNVFGGASPAQWNSAGTWIGANPAAYTGDFINFQVNNVSKFRVDATGKITGDGSGLTGVSASAAGSGGQIQFNNGSNAMAADSMLHWDNSAKRLGLNTSTPGALLDVNGLSYFRSTLYLNSLAAYTGNDIAFANTGKTTFASNVGVGTSSPSSRLHVVSTDTVTNDIATPLVLDHALSSGTATNFIGTGIKFRTQNDSGAQIESFALESYLYPTTAGAENSYIKFYGRSSGARQERMSLDTYRLSLGTGLVNNAVELNPSSYGTFGNNNGGLYLMNNANSWLRLGTNSTTHITIDQNGNVGIGTSTPSDKLQISGGNLLLDDTYSLGGSAGRSLARSNGATAEFANANHNNWSVGLTGDTSQNGVIYTTGGYGSIAFRVKLNGSDRMTVGSTGNVGIGTTNPTAMLDVAGKIGSSAAGAPSLSSCGTTPSISGNDTRGSFTVGTGGVSAWSVSFSSAYSSTPVCVLSFFNSTPTVDFYVSSISTSGFTVTFTAGASGKSLSYICLQ
ncbi:MAG: hypothetical protein K2X47_09300, partial [Bdellovibrionales bacterium]|nr:hypothetical protein [Bdellovibrionales bacterium]